MQSFDLIIVGTGSGNSIPPAFDSWKIALVEKDVFGGTCLNKGCIPSKMFIYAADQAVAVSEAAKLGVHAHVDHIDWPAIVSRIFGRIDPIAAGGEDYRANRCPNITVFRGEGRFVGHKVLEVNGEQLTAPHIILAAGARPHLPTEVAGLDQVPYHTSDTIMRLAKLPERLVILGGGYIGAELGHVFGSFGTQVDFVLRSSMMLRECDDDVSHRATHLYEERFGVHRNCRDVSVSRAGDGVVLRGVSHGEAFELEADQLLVATGRTPNADRLAVAASGVETDATGTRVLTDANLRTNVEGIWALGDLTNELQLKHLANAEGRIVFHNVAHHDQPDRWQAIDRTLVPYAVFGHPQIAGVGLTERAAHAAGLPYLTSTKDYGGTAYGWAMEDSTSFCKLVAHRETRKLLGAHLIGPQASTLIQPLIQGMRFGQTVDEMARDVWYIHPALTEVVENALLDL
ncbi:MAG: mycothione reductase [Acidimicrobiia bacterium]